MPNSHWPWDSWLDNGWPKGRYYRFTRGNNDLGEKICEHVEVCVFLHTPRTFAQIFPTSTDHSAVHWATSLTSNRLRVRSYPTPTPTSQSATRRPNQLFMATYNVSSGSHPTQYHSQARKVPGFFVRSRFRGVTSGNTSTTVVGQFATRNQGFSAPWGTPTSFSAATAPHDTHSIKIWGWVNRPTFTAITWARWFADGGGNYYSTGLTDGTTATSVYAWGIPNTSGPGNRAGGAWVRVHWREPRRCAVDGATFTRPGPATALLPFSDGDEIVWEEY